MYQQKKFKIKELLLKSIKKPRNQVNYSASKANSMLGLYTSYIRPHNEFAVSSWSPYTKQDQNTLEKVQHRATKVASKLKALRIMEPYLT
ncbi:RNA-directed DNA polymerase from mobile element jockey-like [Brachionus plicatilis]|uniref:RNA-directed DNA polymerase from mobile element jockey-like n=1 Tax=Brachionus plicatilis TaxID=10195 RepID=A0A3M7SIK3_BRAPC|nr:RNA-directed DNA polymerase from mobile element jockey-like [Brachionus plicatilis]